MTALIKYDVYAYVYQKLMKKMFHITMTPNSMATSSNTTYKYIMTGIFDAVSG
jgi:hypothetical protein